MRLNVEVEAHFLSKTHHSNHPIVACCFALSATSKAPVRWRANTLALLVFTLNVRNAAARNFSKKLSVYIFKE